MILVVLSAVPCPALPTPTTLAFTNHQNQVFQVIEYLLLVMFWDIRNHRFAPVTSLKEARVPLHGAEGK